MAKEKLKLLYGQSIVTFIPITKTNFIRKTANVNTERVIKEVS